MKKRRKKSTIKARKRKNLIAREINAAKIEAQKQLQKSK